jgi:Pentapeptide repeats (8 copies)
LPSFVSIAGLWVGAKQFSEQQQATAAQTLDQQRQATLTGYLDHMSTLVLHDNLPQSKIGAPVRAIAVALTDTALRNLDGTRKGTLIRYLWQAGLINRPHSVVGLFLMDLNRTKLRRANLFKAVLSHVSLFEADFAHAELMGADLQHSVMISSNLTSADLGCFYRDTDLSLACADLTGADLSYARLRNTVLVGANLTAARLTGADLTRAQYNSKPIHTTDVFDHTFTVEPTIWPRGFDVSASGAVCVDC